VTNIMKKMAGSLCLFLSAFGLSLLGGSGDAYAQPIEYSFLRAKLRIVDLVVPENAEVVFDNSEICLGSEGSLCRIYLGAGAKFFATDTTFGPRVILFEDASRTNQVSFKNTVFHGELRKGLTPDLKKVSGLQPAFMAHEEHSMSNSLEESLNLTLQADQDLKISGSRICLADSRDPCVINMAHGSRIDLSNVKLGHRLSLLARGGTFSGIKFVNVESEALHFGSALTESGIAHR